MSIPLGRVITRSAKIWAWKMKADDGIPTISGNPFCEVDQ